MDSMDLEREKCITIKAKNTSIPVSYTHLDVYKRQAQGGMVFMDDLAPVIPLFEEDTLRLHGKVFCFAGQFHLSLIHIFIICCSK